MGDLGVIDTFVATFSSYIDSGFGLLGPDVAYLTIFLVTIDIVLAGLFWAMGTGHQYHRYVREKGAVCRRLCADPE